MVSGLVAEKTGRSRKLFQIFAAVETIEEALEREFCSIVKRMRKVCAEDGEWEHSHPNKTYG